MSDVVVAFDEPDLLALYFALDKGRLVDLEVAATAAIEWSRGLKAAAHAIDPEFDYRVTFVAAEPGSSKWFARIERARVALEKSDANRSLQRVASGWKRVPLILRIAIGLATVIPTTIKPTYEYWFDAESFNQHQLDQIAKAVATGQADPDVQSHRKRLYKSVQRDQHITGIAPGVAKTTDWKPKQVVSAAEFPLADGLFDLQEIGSHERVVTQTLDVLLVTPRLQNAERAWEFRQEGIPGSFRATMKDRQFLTALDRKEVKEVLRSNIPMRIKLMIKQRYVNGEWKTARKGRSVVEVLQPRVR